MPREEPIGTEKVILPIGPFSAISQLAFGPKSLSNRKRRKRTNCGPRPIEQLTSHPKKITFPYQPWHFGVGRTWCVGWWEVSMSSLGCSICAHFLGMRRPHAHSVFAMEPIAGSKITAAVGSDAKEPAQMLSVHFDARSPLFPVRRAATIKWIASSKMFRCARQTRARA
jgi:hypothetical protein